MSDTPVTAQNLVEAATELKKYVDDCTKGLQSKDPEKEEKFNALFDAADKNISDIKEVKDAAIAVEKKHTERILSLERALAIIGGAGSGKNFKDSAEYKAVLSLFKANSTDEQKSLMRSDIGEDGGFSLTDARMKRVLDDKIVTSPMRKYSTVQPVNDKTTDYLKLDGELESFYEGETEQSDETGQKFALVSVTTHSQEAQIPITQEMLMNSDINIEKLIISRAQKFFEKKTNALCVHGDGVKKPAGFTVNADVLANHSVTTATAGKLQLKDLQALISAQDKEYDSTLFANRKIIVDLRYMQDANGALIWQQGIGDGVSSTIAGEKFAIMPDMSGISANSVSLAYADLKEGYTITEQKKMDVLRNPYTRAGKRIVIFHLTRWNTGSVLVPEAIKLLINKA